MSNYQNYMHEENVKFRCAIIPLPFPCSTVRPLAVAREGYRTVQLVGCRKACGNAGMHKFLAPRRLQCVQQRAIFLIWLKFSPLHTKFSISSYAPSRKRQIGRAVQRSHQNIGFSAWYFLYHHYGA